MSGPWNPSGEVHSGCRVGELLGRGAMGAVFRATPEAGGAPLVIKFLAPGLAGEQKLRERFKREWAALEKVGEHPHVVRVMGVGEGAHAPHVLLELVEGRSLDRILHEQGPLPLKTGVSVALGCARGLGALHGLGLVHRDIKPGNLILQPTGETKIVDFGLAKDLFLSGLTQPGQLMGTAAYMAPELWNDEGVDARSDLFALGATLYHLLAGGAPFQGDELDDIADAIEEGDYEPLGEVVPGTPPGLDQILAQLLDPDPAHRYARAESLVEDFERVLRGEPVSIPCLVHEESQRRFPLLGEEFFTLGSDPGCQVSLPQAGIAPRHAQIRRDEGGFTLRDFQGSSGTWVGELRSPPGKAHTLQDGEEIRIGPLRLRFKNPREGDGLPPYLRDAGRETVSDLEVRTLLARQDRRATLRSIELLAPTPARWAAEERRLAGWVGAEFARAAHERVRARAGQEAALAAAALRSSAPQGPRGEPGAPGLDREWLQWWQQVRLGVPAQCVSSSPQGTLRLKAGGARPLQGVLLLGRDERCGLRVSDPEAPRLALTLLPLERRIAALPPTGLTPERSARLNGVPLTAPAFVEPGDLLELGAWAASYQLPEEPPPRGALIACDPIWFEALLELGSPAVAAALVAFLAAGPQRPWSGERALALGGAEAAALQETLEGFLGARLQQARALLPRLLGGAPPPGGDEAAGWQALLAQRLPSLGAQLAPQGWLPATRDAGA